jgi:hypothetical protein
MSALLKLETPPPQTALVLDIGVTRHFGLRDIGEAGLLSGWARGEYGHAWNDGIDATLLLALPHRPGPMALDFEVEPFVTPQNPVQDLTIFASGARAGFWRVTKRQVTRISTWIDPVWWRDTPEGAAMRLVFHMPLSVSPQELGTCNDLRQLAFNFRSITPTRSETTT